MHGSCRPHPSEALSVMKMTMKMTRTTKMMMRMLPSLVRFETLSPPPQHDPLSQINALLSATSGEVDDDDDEDDGLEDDDEDQDEGMQFALNDDEEEEEEEEEEKAAPPKRQRTDASASGRPEQKQKQPLKEQQPLPEKKQKPSKHVAAAAAAAPALGGSSGGGSGGGGGFFAQTPEGTTFSASSFTDLNLSRPLIKACSALGYTMPTPIQAACIPLALSGRDICGSAITGSGKTAAFTLPILERLLHRPRQVAATYVLILTPTRELAVQIHSMVQKLAQYTDVQAALIVGGLSVQVRAGVAVVHWVRAWKP